MGRIWWQSSSAWPAPNMFVPTTLQQIFGECLHLLCNQSDGQSLVAHQRPEHIDCLGASLQRQRDLQAAGLWPTRHGCRLATICDMHDATVNDDYMISNACMMLWPALQYLFFWRASWRSSVLPLLDDPGIVLALLLDVRKTAPRFVLHCASPSPACTPTDIANVHSQGTGFGTSGDIWNTNLANPLLACESLTNCEPATSTSASAGGSHLTRPSAVDMRMAVSTRRRSPMAGRLTKTAATKNAHKDSWQEPSACKWRVHEC